MNLFMNKNIVHTLASEKKRVKTFTWNNKYKETIIQMCNKMMSHTWLITFLKDMYYLDAC
jgi:hypothetical protein